MVEGFGQPKVSVIIPTFNRRNLLPEAVESCLSQTYKDLEIIIVDDGSTDGTGEHVGRMLTLSWANAGVIYRRQDNAGASSARNHGLRLARGEYIQFIDSDDLLRPTKIARQIAALENPQCKDAPCCHCYGILRRRSGGEEAKQVIGIKATEACVLIRRQCSRTVHVLQTAAPLWRRDYLRRYSGWREDIGLGDDLEYYVRLLADAHQVCFVDDDLFIVREHGGERLGAGGSTVSSLSSLIRARRSVHESVERAGLWDEVTQKAFLGAMRTIYANALKTGDAEMIGNLERWLWELASAPRRQPGFQAMIGARRICGRRLLLGAHRVFKRLRAV